MLFTLATWEKLVTQLVDFTNVFAQATLSEDVNVTFLTCLSPPMVMIQYSSSINPYMGWYKPPYVGTLTSIKDYWNADLL